jgi:hypothetical protein
MAPPLAGSNKCDPYRRSASNPKKAAANGGKASKTNIEVLFTENQQNTTNTNIYVGNSLRPFNGKLGSLKIYKRVLSATEILNKFNATKSRFGY